MIPININLKQIPNQPPEIYYCNKEYKIKLNYSNKNRRNSERKNKSFWGPCLTLYTENDLYFEVSPYCL